MVRTSPGVEFILRDQSDYSPTIDSSVVGVVGFATKGPFNEATLVTSPQNLVRTFGFPNENLSGQGLEGAIEILETTNSIYYVRCGDGTQAEASALMQLGACPAVQVSAQEYGLTTNPLYLQIQVTNHQGVNQYSSNQRYNIPTNTASGTGEGQAHALAKIVGGGDLEADKVGVFFDSTTSTTGYIVGAWAGSGAVLSVSAFSTTSFDPVDGTFALKTVSPSSGDVVAGVGALASSVTAVGATILSGVEYRASSLYPGTGYNYGTKDNGDASGVQLIYVNKGVALWEVAVAEDGATAETYKVGLVSGSNFIEDLIGVDITNKTSDLIKGELYFSGVAATPSKIPNFLDNITSLGALGVRVHAGEGSNNGITNDAIPRFVKAVVDSDNLVGGTDGTGANDNTSLIGSQTANPKTGMYALDDDSLNISIALVPGITAQTVQNALITLAETNNNFVALVSPPVGLSTQNAIDWINGRGSGRTAAINSSWAAVAWPWVKIFSVFDGKDRWYDPAIFVARQMTFTDNVAETWFAPAGFRRGRLTKPTDVEVKLNTGDMNSLYGSNINPIVNFVPEGITIFGQKTTQRAATALDRINVRRLMIFVRKLVLALGRRFVFEPNDEFTWEQVKEAVDPVLDDIRSRRGITKKKVICDDSVNTPVRVDRNELWCKILIKPTKTAEFIVFDVNLTSQTAQFGE